MGHAQFRVKEATGTAGLQINLHANTGSAAWTESGATWNNCGVVLDANSVSATANSNADTYFDITDLVKDWKTGGRDAAKGFVLVSTNETTLDKAFYSSEFATTGYRPYVTVTYNDSNPLVVSDGVYRIISKSANKPIGAAQSIAEWTDVATQNTYTESALEMFQLWKITHLANGLYSIRPLHKLTMGLHASGTDVYICATSTIDTIVSIPTIARWQIQETSNGYTFQQLGNPSATLMAATSATGSGVDICIGTYSASSAQCHFELSPVEDMQGALFLFNTSNNTYTSSLSTGMPTISIGVGTPKTLAEIGYTLSVCDPYDTSQSVAWSSSNPAVAIVDSNTGTVTPLSVGETTIRAERTIEDTHHIVEYSLVTTFSEGRLFIRNKESGEYVTIADQSVSLNMQIQQQAFHGGDTQRWVFTNLGNDIYTIRYTDSATTYYLSISGSTSYAGQSIVPKTGTINDSMKWKIVETTSGAYKLIPLTGETDGIVLGTSAENAHMLKQQDYTDDANYDDEWLLHLEGDYSLMYIGYTNGDPLMPPIMQTVESSLICTAGMYGYASTSTSKAELKEQLSSSKIFSCITHGGRKSITCFDAEFTTDDVDALDDSAFDNLTFVCLGACSTGEGKSDALNLVNAFYEKGADTVIGFTIGVNVNELNSWIPAFMTSLAQGNTIDDALDDADYEVMGDDANPAHYSISSHYRYIAGSTSIAPCD